jgi:hypothetical protein
MGDWERTFGSHGMQNGGMGVIDGITADDEDDRCFWRPNRGPSTQPFSTWSEASQFAQKYREWRVVRGEGVHPFLVKRDMSDAQNTQDKLAEKLTLDTLQQISKWPSGLRDSGGCFYRKRYFQSWFQTYEEFIPSGSDCSASSLTYCAKYLCIRITNVMPGVKFTELVPFEIYTMPQMEFRDWVDNLLDTYEAPPA